MLDVYLSGEHIGTLTQDTAGVSFAYNERALDEPARCALSVRLPVRREVYPHHRAAPFFDNLLPEGDARALLAQAAKYDPSDVQGLLGAIGGECAGAVSLWPTGEAPASVAEYVPCSAADLEQLFTDPDARAFTQAHVMGRQSMSGAQNKLVLLRRGTSYALPRRGAPTNVLLKRERSRYPGLVQNELASLRLMAAAGVPVADATAPVGMPGLFESRRYDRVAEGEMLTRLHQEDFCQATGKLPRQKYQRQGGPTLADLATVIVRHSAEPLIDLERLTRWVLANVCLGNNDAHAKNLSLLYTPGGPRLAPAYDVVCTLAYPALDQEFSLALGGVYTLDAMTGAAFRKLARTLQMSHGHLRHLLDDVTTRLRERVDAVCDEVATSYGDASVLRVLRGVVRERTAMVRERGEG